MRKKNTELREAILDYARHVADTEGTDAINIRRIADQAGIAIGTIYNYFSNKEEILLALTEEYWRQTLHEMKGNIQSASFCGQLAEIYTFLYQRLTGSAGNLMGSLRNVEPAGRERMRQMQQVLRGSLMQRMAQDADIRRDIWDEHFTKEQMADFIMLNMMAMLQMGTMDIRFFLEIIKRTLY